MSSGHAWLTCMVLFSVVSCRFLVFFVSWLYILQGQMLFLLFLECSSFLLFLMSSFWGLSLTVGSQIVHPFTALLCFLQLARESISSPFWGLNLKLFNPCYEGSLSNYSIHVTRALSQIVQSMLRGLSCAFCNLKGKEYLLPLSVQFHPLDMCR